MVENVFRKSFLTAGMPCWLLKLMAGKYTRGGQQQGTLISLYIALGISCRLGCFLKLGIRVKMKWNCLQQCISSDYLISLVNN